MATLLAGLLMLPLAMAAQTNVTQQPSSQKASSGGGVRVELNGGKSLLTTEPVALAEQKLIMGMLEARNIDPADEEFSGGSSTIDTYGRALTLRDCIDIALGESPLLEANRFDLLAATEEIRATRAMSWPHLKGSLSGEIFSGESTGRFGIVNVKDTGIGLSSGQDSVDFAGIGVAGATLRYPLFEDGSILGLNTSPAVAAKKAQKVAFTWAERVRREEVIYRVTDTFIATALAQNRQQFVDERVGLLEKSVEIIQEQRNQGLLLPSDLKLANDQLRAARSLSTIIHQQVTAGKLELTKALGSKTSTHIRLSTALPQAPDPPRVDQLLDGPLGQHPSLQMQRATIDKTKQEYRLERYRLFPTVSLEGSALYADDFNPPGSHLYVGAITVRVPIFDFGEQSATVRAKRMKYLAERARLASVADDVANDIVKTYENIYALSEKMLTLQQEIGKAETEWRVAESHEEEGLTQPLESIRAHLVVIDKRDELYGYEARRLLNYAALQKATCGAWKWLP